MVQKPIVNVVKQHSASKKIALWRERHCLLNIKARRNTFERWAGTFVCVCVCVFFVCRWTMPVKDGWVWVFPKMARWYRETV